MRVPELEKLKRGEDPDAKERRRVQLAYCQTFLNSETGQFVLEHMCMLAGFYEEIREPAKMIEMNFMLKILKICGLDSKRRRAKIVQELRALTR